MLSYKTTFMVLGVCYCSTLSLHFLICQAANHSHNKISQTGWLEWHDKFIFSWLWKGSLISRYRHRPFLLAPALAYRLLGMARMSMTVLSCVCLFKTARFNAFPVLPILTASHHKRQDLCKLILHISYSHLRSSHNCLWPLSPHYLSEVLSIAPQVVLASSSFPIALHYGAVRFFCIAVNSLKCWSINFSVTAFSAFGSRVK